MWRGATALFAQPHSETFMRSTVVLSVLVSSLAVAESSGQTRATVAPTGNMTMRRSQHTATLLQNGEVLITGGVGGDMMMTPVSSTEIFDPVAGTFKKSSNRSVPRRMHSATLLPDGRVLIAGGF